MHNNDEHFMKKAILVAQRAGNLNEVPVGAIVVSPHGEILGRGFNETESKKCQCAHAEINAIREASR